MRRWAASAQTALGTPSGELISAEMMFSAFTRSWVDDCFIAMGAASRVGEVGWWGDVGPRAEVVIGFESEVGDHVGGDDLLVDSVDQFVL